MGQGGYPFLPILFSMAGQSSQHADQSGIEVLTLIISFRMVRMGAQFFSLAKLHSSQNRLFSKDFP